MAAKTQSKTKAPVVKQAKKIPAKAATIKSKTKTAPVKAGAKVPVKSAKTTGKATKKRA